MSTYDELIATLFSKRPQFLNAPLDQVRAISKMLGNPERAFPCVHIAGTNGKGSVAFKVAKALEFSGLKVGLFTSPHLFSYRERIQINSVMITEEDVVFYLSRLLPLMEKSYPSASFFEITTCLALGYFKEKNIDIAVMEAGIGGLLDTTNIITPLVSVITSIGNDHKELLGPTLDDIARHKAGIIKPSIPVVLGPSAVFPVIYQIAKEHKSVIHLAQAAPGFYDWENQNIARKTLAVLSNTLSLKCSEEALSLRPPCRFEQLDDVIFDVAHNADGFSRLIEALATFFPHRKWVCILGMSKEKDLEASLSRLSQHASHFYLVETKSERAVSQERMGALLLQHGYSAFTYATIEQAIELALSQEDLIVVCGSFYLMQEARSVLFRKVGA
jgi:dihydrofolate synthase/folylpolyglutamate synthase